MNHLDLFSGIGGFSLAVDRVWHEKENQHTFVEWDDFCTEVLKKHWPDAEYHKDIRQFVADTTSKRGEFGRQTSWDISRSQKGIPRRNHCDLITGGFPCQPFSQAGRRKGTADDRYLWPPMLECITLFRPRWVIAENVSGIATWNDGLVLETVCADLESAGYEVQPIRVPAVSVGAPHRRDRWWFVAHTSNADDRGNTRELPSENELKTQERQEERPAELSGANNRDASYAANDDRRSGRKCSPEASVRTYGNYEPPRSNWSENWTEVATSLCRVDARVSTWVDGRGKVRPSRNNRLKALGNSIVPQVAEQIMLAIKSVDDVL